MVEVRVANSDDYVNIKHFYDSLIDSMESSEYKPGWKRDVYPTQKFLLDSIQKRELFVGESDGAIAACMIMNHDCNDGYKEIQWSIDVEDTKISVLHALGVHPLFSGKGIAKQMVQEAIDTSRNEGMKTIRLDVLEGNIPAEKAYERMGFQYIDTIQMFYEDTGWTTFNLFELVL